jgi:hypothetical protein
VPEGTFIATCRHFTPFQISEIGGPITPFVANGPLPTATQNFAETHETAASDPVPAAAFAGVATPAAHSTVTDATAATTTARQRRLKNASGTLRISSFASGVR